MSSRCDSQSPPPPQPPIQPNLQNWLNLGAIPDTETQQHEDQNNALMENIFGPPPQQQYYIQNPSQVNFIPSINTEGQFIYPRNNIPFPLPPQPYVQSPTLMPNYGAPSPLLASFRPPPPIPQPHVSGGSRHGSRHGSRGFAARAPS